MSTLYEEQKVKSKGEKKRKGKTKNRPQVVVHTGDYPAAGLDEHAPFEYWERVESFDDAPVRNCLKKRGVMAARLGPVWAPKTGSEDEPSNWDFGNLSLWMQNDETIQDVPELCSFKQVNVWSVRRKG